MISPETILKSEKLYIVTDAARIQQALSRKLDTQLAARGEIILPCAPALLEEYMQRLETLLTTIGKPFSKGPLDKLRQVLARRLEEGFLASPHSRLLIKYESQNYPSYPQTNISITIKTIISSVQEQYDSWAKTREPPLFGSHPDAKVMDIASKLGEASLTPILDVGAGTGRNTLPLALLGYPVHALELTPAFARQLLGTVVAKGLPAIVTQGDVLDPTVPLALGHYKLAIASEVVSHFRSVEQLQQLLARMCEVLRPGGFLLFNMFLATEGYSPDALAREMSQVAWSSMFTRTDLAAAIAGLPLQLVSDESAYEYEKAHLPAEAWPPTGWYNTWATGRDLFPIAPEQPPMELRWLLYKRL